jgi:hypothetical protein
VASSSQQLTQKTFSFFSLISFVRGARLKGGFQSIVVSGLVTFHSVLISFWIAIVFVVFFFSVPLARRRRNAGKKTVSAVGAWCWKTDN